MSSLSTPPRPVDAKSDVAKWAERLERVVRDLPLGNLETCSVEDFVKVTVLVNELAEKVQNSSAYRSRAAS